MVLSVVKRGKPTHITPEPLGAEMDYNNSVKSPQHYISKSGLQAITFIQDFELDYCLGNVAKYIIRAGKKAGEDRLKDLLKAQEYLSFEIAAERHAAQPIGANMPEGFTALKSDLKGLAAYTQAATLPPRTTVDVIDLADGEPARGIGPDFVDASEIYDTVAEQVMEVLPKVRVDRETHIYTAELTDLLCQVLLLLSQRQSR